MGSATGLDKARGSLEGGDVPFSTSWWDGTGGMSLLGAEMGGVCGRMLRFVSRFQALPQVKRSTAGQPLTRMRQVGTQVRFRMYSSVARIDGAVEESGNVGRVGR